MIEAGLAALLGGNPAIQAFVGGAPPNARIFAGDAPPDFQQMPCIAYSLVGGSSDPTFNTTGMLHQRVEINVFAEAAVNGIGPALLAAQIRDLVIATVAGWQQKLANGARVCGADLVNPGTDFVNEQRIFRRMCEFRIHYTLPTS